MLGTIQTLNGLISLGSMPWYRHGRPVALPPGRVVLQKRLTNCDDWIGFDATFA